MMSSAALVTLILLPLAGQLQDLHQMLRPEYETIAELGEEAESLFLLMERSAANELSIDSARRFSELPNLPRQLRAYALVRHAQLEAFSHRPDSSVITLRRIIHEFSDVPEIAMLAGLEMGRLMVQSGGALPGFNPTIVEIQEVYDPIFEKYPPYNHHMIRGHYEFAQECVTAAQEPLYRGFADVARSHINRALAIIDAVEARPSLVSDAAERRLLLSARPEGEFLLAETRGSPGDSEIEGSDLFPLQLRPAEEIPRPEAVDRDAIRALVESDVFIDARTAESLATHCELDALAALGDYVGPSPPIAWQTNALHILSYVRYGETVSWAFDKVFYRELHSSELDEAIAARVNPYNFLERTTNYGGRQEHFARVYGMVAVPAICRALDWDASPRAQRNAAYFAAVFPHDPVRASLRERLRSIPPIISDAGDHPLNDTFRALGAIGTPEDLSLLAEMATVAYWENRSIPVWEPYRIESRSLGDSRDRWRYHAVAGLKASRLPEAEAHLRRLRSSTARDLFR